MIQKQELTKLVRKYGTTDEYVTAFISLYELSIKKHDACKLLHEYVINKNRHALNYCKRVLKLGEEYSYKQYEAFLKFQLDNTPKDSMSEGYFKALVGDNWEVHYLKRKKSIVSSLSTYIKKHGKEKGTELYESVCKSRGHTIENYISRLGKEKGTELYESWRNSNKGNLTLERKIEIHGEEKGTQLYNKMKDKFKHKNTLNYYISLFGKEEGTQRYNDRSIKNSKSSKKNSIRKTGTPAYIEYRAKMEKSGEWLPLSNLTEFELYSRNVWQETENQDLTSLKNFENRGHQSFENTYAIDHIISIKYGFINNICYKIIGNIDNLQMLTHSDNSSKGTSCYCVIGAK